MAPNMRQQHDATITKASISALVISLPIIYVSLLRVPPSTLARDTTFWFLMSNSIIAIIAADSGMLFFRAAAGASHHDVSADEQPAVATQQISYEDATWVMARPDEPTMVGISDVVVGDEELVGKDGPVASNDVRALALIKDDGAASKPCGTDMGHTHASVLQRREEEEEEEEEEASAQPISIDKNCAMTVKGDFASKKIVKGDQWPILDPRTTTPDDHVPKDEGSAGVAREEMKPARCSVTEEISKPPDEREYWQLSDEELNRKVEEFITRFNRDMVEQEARV